MRLRSKHNGSTRPFRSVLLPAVLSVVAGCASMPGGDVPDGAERTGAEARDDAHDGTPAAQAPIERKRGDYPEIETHETGFTITEQVRIGGRAREQYENALQLLRQDRVEQGIEALQAVTETAPELTAPYIDLGIAYGRAGELERAEAAFDRASRLAPEHPIVHNELGIVYRKTGRFREARAAYERALATYPGFHFARRNLAVLCDLYLSDLDCALEHYEAYMGSVGDDEQVEIWIADVRNRLGR